MAGLFARKRKIDIDVLGSTIRLSFPSDEPNSHYEQLREAWSAARVPKGRPDATLSITTNVANSQDADVYGPDFSTFASNVSTHVTLKGIELARGTTLMLHAAGIALPDGRVIAFVAPSGAGKTTLASVLGKQYGYVSDETVLIERDLTVKPYRKPLSVIEDPEKPRHKTQISPDSLGLKELPSAPLRLAAIVLFYRGDEYANATLETIPLPDAVDDLSGQISYFGEIPDSVVMLADIVENIGGIRVLRYRNSEDVTQLVDEILEERGEHTRWRDVSSGGTAADSADVYVRRPGIAAVETNGSIITTSDNTIRVLAGLAPVIWEQARDGASLDDLEQALIAKYGEPEGASARDLTKRAADTLVVEGLLQFRSSEPAVLESP